ncbi:MAG TPA: rhomboid family intramembrane serine protease [Anaerolineales bacterium]|nr:rhomboid family intramembrane serine protease [Anaerolineales bacterium]
MLRKQAACPSNSRDFYFPQTTFLLFLAVAIPSILQFFFPSILPLFQRDYQRFLSGNWWRIITPLFVQDGGLGGTIFNLAGLLLIGSIAERLWGGRFMFMIFFVGGILGEIVAFAWQPVGAGNSISNFSLAASIAIACLTRHSPKPVQIAAFLALSIDGILIGLQDIHGAAALAGAILALVLKQFGKVRLNDY